MNLLLFLLVVLLAFALFIWVDLYCYRKVKEFLRFRNEKLDRWYYWSVRIMPVVLLVATALRRLYPVNSPFVFALLLLASIWYLPKLPLAVFLVFLQLSKKFKKSEVKTSVPQRRRILKGFVSAGIAYPYIVSTYGAVDTTYRLIVREKELTFSKLPQAFDPLIIAQISDFHTGSFVSPQRFFEKVVEKVNAFDPDIIVITGDWVNFDPEELRPILPILRQLRARFGIYGCLGNHDHYMSKDHHNHLQQLIRSQQIDLLVNESRLIVHQKEQIAIAGTDNTGTGQHFGDLPKALANIPSGTFTVLLAHTPSYWDREVREDVPVDLMLAGHTHGGQLAIPVGFAKINPAYLVFRYVQGLYTRPNGQMLYVNAGLGTTFFPLRTAVPPEITILRLRKSSNKLNA